MSARPTFIRLSEPFDCLAGAQDKLGQRPNRGPSSSGAENRDVGPLGFARQWSSTSLGQTVNILTISLSLAISTPANAAYKLVAKNTPRTVAKSGLTVTPPTDWNRLPERIGKHAESWTLDGLSLNEVDFYGGIAEGEPLIRDFDKKERPLPRFSATMLPPDIVSLYETTFRVATGSAHYETGKVEPATFAGMPGVRFTYRYITSDEVRRSGEAIGATIDGKLYLIAFNAPETHYFAHDLENFRKIAASARVVALPAGK